MTGLRLDLANPDSFDSPKDYVEKHLAPVVTELHRLVNELLVPGASSAEEWGMDMRPAPGTAHHYTRLVRPLFEQAKHATFDGSEYFTLPKELLRSKQVKVQLSATVYSYAMDREIIGLSQFRLVDENGDTIDGSSFETLSQTPVHFTQVLPFGEQRGSVHPSRITYFIEARAPEGRVIPVCRRFSMSFVYI